ncbi:FxsA family protein [Corynebacterium meitnerae]|uniref:FxsA family protein n=1 Tax=Corynebacterium meitnerae TaxID=2913498 RepID=A0A9X3LRQ7_9CORY|nr:FxsA family protein [Corynebacterium meitnerae]MCZ9292995.1 FxsA family protein [Corynebacterium meitnerae]
MPFFVTYVLIEALAFWGVSKLVGVGWALAGLFILMAIGAVSASVALRAELQRASTGASTMGQFAGGTALVAAGWGLSVIPGYVSSLVGALLVFRPTRELVRSSLARSWQKKIEDFGVKFYSSTPMSGYSPTYGSFIDHDEIEQWSKEARPEDFGEAGEQR